MDGEEKKDVAASFHYPQHTNTGFLLLFIRVEGSFGREGRLENDWRVSEIPYLCIYSINKCIDLLLWAKCKCQALGTAGGGQK